MFVPRIRNSQEIQNQRKPPHNSKAPICVHLRPSDFDLRSSHSPRNRTRTPTPQTLFGSSPVIIKNMRPVILAITLLLPATAIAQQSHGYAFLGGTFSGRGDISGAFRYGIGGEARVLPLLTIGGEFGGIAHNGNGILASGNASFHVPTGSSVDPFLTAGVSVAHKSGATGAYVNLGGGLNYWFHSHFGARMELRGYPGGQDLGSFAEIRVGLAFR
jgi:hypothetical protein